MTNEIKKKGKFKIHDVLFINWEYDELENKICFKLKGQITNSASVKFHKKVKAILSEYSDVSKIYFNFANLDFI